MHRVPIILTILLIVLCSTVTAQTNSPDRMTIQAGYGTVTMGDVQWQRFSFRPDIPLGTFGLGLDFEVFIDEEGRISKEGWDFSNKNQTWDTIIRKIYYARYGKPMDRFYARAGALDNVTLGYGLVMDEYRNTLAYPADKKLGVDLAVREVGTFGLDVHGMINSVGDFKNDGAVVGGRVAFKPLKPFAGNILGRFTVGATFVRDINQYAGLKDSDADGYPDFQDGFPDDGNRYADSDGDGYEDGVDIDDDGDNELDTLDPFVERQEYIDIRERKNGVSVYGLDLGLPLLNGPVRLDLYGQYSAIRTGDEATDGGWGVGVPGLRLLFNRFSGQVEYRHFEGNFRPSYFDNLYEHERVRLVGTTPVTKEMSLDDESLNGVWGRLGYDFFGLAAATASYQTMQGDRSFHDLTGTASVNERTLKNVPKISLLEAYFYNRYVEDTADLLKHSPNMLYGTRVGFEITPGVMIVWDTRYTFTPRANGGLESNRFVSIETVMMVR
jgi:hypothetical protein